MSELTGLLDINKLANDLAEEANELPSFDTIDQLRDNILQLGSMIYVDRHNNESESGGGTYQLLEDDRLSTDDDGFIIVDRIGNRWRNTGVKRDANENIPLIKIRTFFLNEIVVSPDMYGAHTNIDADSTDYFKKMFKTLDFIGRGIAYINNTYRITKDLDLPDNIKFVGTISHEEFEKLSDINTTFHVFKNNYWHLPKLVLNKDVILNVKGNTEIYNLIFFNKDYLSDLKNDSKRLLVQYKNSNIVAYSTLAYGYNDFIELV